MERLTKKLETDRIYVTKAISGVLKEEGYYGEAIDKLGKFEDLYEFIKNRQKAIPIELERLRKEKKEKTVTFKELLSEKMVNELLLVKFEMHEI